MEVFESKGVKVNLRETKMIICGSIAKDGLSNSKVDPCGFCSLRLIQFCGYNVICGSMVDVPK